MRYTSYFNVQDGVCVTLLEQSNSEVKDAAQAAQLHHSSLQLYTLAQSTSKLPPDKIT